jgi:hypothetical protein
MPGSEFESGEQDAVNSLQRYGLSRKEIVRWLDAGCSVEEVEEWLRIAGDFKSAIGWREAGFSPFEESTEVWIKWGCSPSSATSQIRQGVLSPPPLAYRDFGISLDDAVYFDTTSFSADGDYNPFRKDFDAQNHIGTWLPSGLSPQQILLMRAKIAREAYLFEDLHSRSAEHLGEMCESGDFWTFLPLQFEYLTKVGLPINTENLKLYWGLSNDEILQVIDSGATPSVATELVRRGVLVSKVDVVERLIELGATQELALTLAAKGFLMKHLKLLESKGIYVTELQEILEMFGWLPNDSSIDDAITWYLLEDLTAPPFVWVENGFGPEDALRWSQEGFRPELARMWRDSGVDSPLLAKRRGDAGIQP